MLTPTRVDLWAPLLSRLRSAREAVGRARTEELAHFEVGRLFLAEEILHSLGKLLGQPSLPCSI